MNIQRLPITRLTPAPYNPRRALKPGDPRFEKLARSLSEFDLVQPLVWNCANRTPRRRTSASRRCSGIAGGRRSTASWWICRSNARRPLNVTLNNSEVGRRLGDRSPGGTHRGPEDDSRLRCDADRLR